MDVANFHYCRDAPMKSFNKFISLNQWRNVIPEFSQPQNRIKALIASSSEFILTALRLPAILNYNNNVM